jgi:hypothetical protein
MTPIKITKRMLKLHPADLLLKINAVDETQKMGYPQHVFFSKEDYAELRKNLKKNAKKEIPYAGERLLNYSVEMDLLNLGPNQGLEDVIKPGYALIDWASIKKEKMGNGA